MAFAFLKVFSLSLGVRSLSAEASIAQAVPIGLWPLGLRLEPGQLFALGLGTELAHSLAPAKNLQECKGHFGAQARRSLGSSSRDVQDFALL